MQQLFRLVIFLNQPYMFRTKNSPILRSTFWLYIHLLVQCTDTAADRCHTVAPVVSVRCPKSCIYSQKCSWGWANLSPETCRADLKRLKRLMNEKLLHLVGCLHRWSSKISGKPLVCLDAFQNVIPNILRCVVVLFQNCKLCSRASVQ